MCITHVKAEREHEDALGIAKCRSTVDKKEKREWFENATNLKYPEDSQMITITNDDELVHFT